MLPSVGNASSMVVIAGVTLATALWTLVGDNVAFTNSSTLSKVKKVAITVFVIIVSKGMVLISIALKMVYTFLGETATPRISVPNIEPAILSAMIARRCADRDDAKRMFEDGLTQARRMTWYNNYDVLREIAVNQAQSSRFRFIDEAKATFQEAITAARVYTSETKVVHKGLKNKAEALANIAKSQAQSGFRDEAKVTFQEAKVTFQEAITAAKAWTSNIKVFHRGLNVTAERIIQHKVEVLANIAKCQAQSGFIDEARVTFQEARDVAYTIDDPKDKAEALKYIQKCFPQWVMFCENVRRFFNIESTS